MRRWRWLAFLATWAVGCGLQIEGLAVAPVGDAGAADARTDVVDADTVDAPTGEDGPRDAAVPDADAATPFCDPNDPSQLACFPFDDTLTDESGAKRAADTSTGVTYVDGVHGQALAVGNATQLRFPATPAWPTTPITIEMWVKPGTLPTGGARQGFIDKDQQWGIFLYPQGVTCSVAASVTSPPIAAGTWTHVACVASGTRTTVYINGADAGSVASGAINTSTAETHVGSNSPDFHDAFVGGAIDDLRILNVARSAAEIQADATR